ncbi:MAG: hypothetical protein HOP19_05440 [Acidobacteria bacterium]|nr:hypothetical protein [Acidobacteriota bacterium]
MKTDFLHEPELEFGLARHIDIRFGLMNYCPLDFDQLVAPKNIRLGIVGTKETIEGLTKWLEKCQSGIAAKSSKRPNLFPQFPGFGEGASLNAGFILDQQLQRSIPQRRFEELCQKPKSDEVLQEIAKLFLDEMEDLVQKTSADVLVCAFPFVLVEYLDQDELGDITDSERQDDPDETGAQPISLKFVLHDYLKAKAMRLRKPTQIIRPGTYDERKRLKQKHPAGKVRQLQDEATRAWNLYTAIYYKAGGIPWRLVRESSELDTCFVGVSFYKSLDGSRTLTSCAQVFNERGEGVIVRGGVAHISDTDKQIHLSEEEACKLLRQSLENYHREHKNFPARVVIHKSSVHNADEIIGFEKAMKEFSIDPEQADFVSLTKAYTRLFRGNRYPPLRGTFFDTGGDMFILYTKGSVDFFSAYPGLYVPRPLGFRCDKVSSTPIAIAEEILALTKMNWNNTQFDGSQPITLRASRQVGNILKYLGKDDHIEPYYRFYM